MKIHGNDPVGGPNEVQPRPSAARSQPPGTPAPPGSSDRVELSSVARELARAREAALAAPEVRETLVERIRHEIDSGLYQPDVRAIAKGVLEDLRAGLGA